MRTPAVATRRRRCISLLVTVLIAIGWACGSQPIRAPTSPAPTQLLSRYRVSGIVMDAAGGVPIANAAVMLRHNQGELTTRTDGNGSYAFSFDTGGPIRPGVASGDFLGLLITGDGRYWGDTSHGHWTAVQLLPWDATEIVHNVRLHPVRTLAAGQSMALSIDPDSSLKWDAEWDPWTFVSYDTLWEKFLVSVPTDGVLTIDVRPDGDTVPTLWCQYGGCPSFQVQGSVSIPVHAGTLYFHVEIPRTRAPQRFDIRTSLR